MLLLGEVQAHASHLQPGPFALTWMKKDWLNVLGADFQDL